MHGLLPALSLMIGGLGGALVDVRIACVGMFLAGLFMLLPI